MAWNQTHKASATGVEYIFKYTPQEHIELLFNQFPPKPFQTHELQEPEGEFKTVFKFKGRPLFSVFLVSLTCWVMSQRCLKAPQNCLKKTFVTIAVKFFPDMQYLFHISETLISPNATYVLKFWVFFHLGSRQATPLSFCHFRAKWVKIIIIQQCCRTQDRHV